MIRGRCEVSSGSGAKAEVYDRITCAACSIARVNLPHTENDTKAGILLTCPVVYCVSMKYMPKYQYINQHIIICKSCNFSLAILIVHPLVQTQVRIKGFCIQFRGLHKCCYNQNSSERLQPDKTLHFQIKISSMKFTLLTMRI